MKNQKTRKTLLKNILALTSIGLLASGVATGIVLSTNSNKINNLKTTTNRIVGKYSHDEGVGDEITQIQLDDHIEAVSDKLQLQLKAAWIDDETIAQTVGTFKANLNNFQPQMSDDLKASKQEILNQKYAYLNDQAKQLGIEVADFNAYQKSIIPQTHKLYIEDLMNAGVDTKTAQKTADEMVNLQLTSLQQAQRQLCSDLDLALLMANTQSLAKFDINAVKSHGEILLSERENQSRLINTQLHAVLNYASSVLNDHLIVQDNGKFIPMLKDYAADGKYGIGDEIEAVDLQNLFHFTYNATYGADLTQYEIQNLAPTTSGEYDTNIVKAISVDAPLGSYENEFASYELGDIIPGYQLRAKIVSMDDTTDSHKCKISFLFGVSRDNDPNTVVWQENESEKIINESSTNDIVLSVNDNINRAYIAQNKYYVDQQPANVVGNFVPDANGSWFGDTANQRNKIEVVLAKAFVNADTGEYDFVNHPLFLDDPSDIEGIPSTNNLDLDNAFHTNQTIKLKVSYANTNADGASNLSYLTMNYCYVDDNYGVKDIPWSINGKIYNTLNIKYELSQEIMDDISIATSAIDLIDSYKYGVDNFTLISGENMKQVKSLYTTNISFNSVQIATNVLLAGALFMYGVMIYSSFGTNIDAIKNVAICAAAVAINVACVAMTSLLLSDEGKINQKFTNLHKTVNASNVKTTIDNAFDSIQTYKQHIKDPLYNIVGKDEDCKKVIDIKKETFQTDAFDPIIEIMGKDNNWDDVGIAEAMKTLKCEGNPSSAKSIAYDALSILTLAGTLATFAHAYCGLGMKAMNELNQTRVTSVMEIQTSGSGDGTLAQSLTPQTASGAQNTSAEPLIAQSHSQDATQTTTATRTFNERWGTQVRLLIAFLTALDALETIVQFTMSHFEN